LKRLLHDFEELQLIFSVRKATIDDLNSLHRIEAECFTNDAYTKDQLAYCLEAPNFVTLVALVNGEIIGFIAGSFEVSAREKVGHIYTLDVKQSYRKLGVGGRLLESFESSLSEKGVRVFYLEVQRNNVLARRLYSKYSYKPCGMLRNYYGPGIDAIMLKKTLS
jgi:ribosomal-protein-alanine acetyltransferase